MNALRPTVIATALFFTLAAGLAGAQNADQFPEQQPYGDTHGQRLGEDRHGNPGKRDTRIGKPEDRHDGKRNGFVKMVLQLMERRFGVSSFRGAWREFQRNRQRQYDTRQRSMDTG